MASNMDPKPKYVFGLMETPAISSFDNDSNAESGIRRRPMSSSSTGPYRSTSTGSAFGRHAFTPATGTSSVRSRTPGSRRTPFTTSSTTPAVNHTAVIVALVEGRGNAKGDIGMASIDLKRPVLTLSQFSDSQTYINILTKLQILDPIEIIMPNTSCDGGTMTPLFKLINEQFTNTTINTVQRRYFNENSGLQYIKHLCLPEYSTVQMEIRSKYYCLATTAALIKYIEFIQNVVYAPASLKVIFRGNDQTTMIDATTITNLELLLNALDSHSHHSLYGIMNCTKTPMGARLLKSSIQQPPCDLETIMIRQEAVAELTENGTLFYGIQNTISRFLDLDHLLSLCVMVPKQEGVKVAESKITNVIHLKHALELVEPLRDALKESKNTLFKTYHDMLEDTRFDAIKEKIDTVIHEDARLQKGSLNMRTQKCFAVKQNINGLLDVARRTYTEIVDDLANMVQELAEKHNLPLRTGYSAGRGFFIQLYCGGKDNYKQENLPGVFIKVNKYKNTLSFTTTEIITLNVRIKESLQEIYIMTNVVVTELMKDVVDHLGCLYKLTDCVAVLDMLVAFAHNCTRSTDYVKPEFTDTLSIVQGRHPILDHINVEEPVPNNVYASDESNFMVITGPNMSGKSTYLRQIVLLQVMAQVGSFVPAQYASFRVTDQIFSRIGSEDDIETNSSSFTVEMREINYIVRNATGKSLIIIDELGRGTSADEGVGICHAICEHLMNTKAFTFFATHFMDLTNLESLYPNVENLHFEVQKIHSAQAGCAKIAYTHALTRGRTKQKHYGLQLAEVSTLPKEVIEGAKTMADMLSQQKQGNMEMSKESQHHMAVYKLGTRLAQTAANSLLDQEDLKDYLLSLKKQYLADIEQHTEDEE